MRLSFALLFLVGSTAQAQFKDPAVPQLLTLEPMDAPLASSYTELLSGAPAKSLSAQAKTEDWPSFQGSRRDGKSRESGLLTTWPTGGPSLVWSMQRGPGYSSPVVQGERLIYSHQGPAAQTWIDCLHAETGKRFWRYAYSAEHTPMYPSFAGPRSTPIIEGSRVWIHGVEGVFHCLDLSTGRVLWKRDLKQEFELEEQFFGVVSSPLLLGDNIIINLGAPQGPTVAAFDKTSGKLVWGMKSQGGMSCASPMLAPLHGEDRLFVLTGGKSRPPRGELLVLDPAQGEMVASFPFRSRTYESVNGCNPVVVDSSVFLTSKYSTGSIGVRLDKGAQAAQAWRAKRLGIEFSTPIVHRKKLFLIDGVRDRGGALVCLDPQSGTELLRTDLEWEEQVLIDGEERTLDAGVGTGSLLHVGGDRFLCLGDNGHLVLIESTQEKTTVLERTALFHASETWTPLVLSRGLLYVCQNKSENLGQAPPRLMCFDLRGK